MDQEFLPRTSARERTALKALEEDADLVERPLKMKASIPVNFIASLIHLESVELDTSTYG